MADVDTRISVMVTRLVLKIPLFWRQLVGVVCMGGIAFTVLVKCQSGPEEWQYLEPSEPNLIFAVQQANQRSCWAPDFHKKPEFLARLHGIKNIPLPLMVEGVWDQKPGTDSAALDRLNRFFLLHVRIIDPLGTVYASLDLTQTSAELHTLIPEWQKMHEIQDIKTVLQSIGPAGVRGILCGAVAFAPLDESKPYMVYESHLSAVEGQPTASLVRRQRSFRTEGKVVIEDHTVNTDNHIDIDNNKVHIETKFSFGPFSSHLPGRWNWYGQIADGQTSLEPTSFVFVYENKVNQNQARDESYRFDVQDFL